MFSFCSWFSLRFVDIVVLRGDRGWGEDATYERGGDARWKFWIKPLKETDLGVAQAFLTPKRDRVKAQIFIFFHVQP